jgi:DNA-binding transcriptional regulator YiaG
MREYAPLCVEPTLEYSSKNIRALRARHKLSQAVLASALNTSVSTVRQWEIGEKRPSGPESTAASTANICSKRTGLFSITNLARKR